MTIASEITRLQWAKADIKSSIEWKWVSVPSDAKLDTYDTYIDQIQQWDGWVLAWWLRLYDVNISGNDWTPSIRGSVSWIEDWKYYGCCVNSFEWSQASSLASYVYTYRKVDTINDMSYTLNNVTWYQSSWIYSYASSPSFWVNWTDMKIIFFVWSTYSSNPIFCYKAIWDYKNWWTTVNSLAWRWETVNIADYPIDLTWYTQKSWEEWVKSVTWHNMNDDAYIYLTLK